MPNQATPLLDHQHQQHLLKPDSRSLPPHIVSPGSNEADDERSSFVSSSYHDPPLPASNMPKQYPTQDTRPTSSKELAGWYAYGWAAEVFVVCGVGSFIPITLEQLARERGVLLSDHSTPCTQAPPLTNDPPNDSDSQCVIRIGALQVNTASFAMYTFSLSVLLQALLIISMSGAADHGTYRKFLLLVFAFAGSIATMLFLPVTPDLFLLGPLFAIIANTCFGASFVLLNSFLPLLVRHHPSLQEPELVSSPVLEEHDYTTPLEEDDPVADQPLLLPADGPDTTLPAPPTPNTPSPALQLSTKISSNGIGIGYLAAVIVQIASVAIVFATGSSLWSLRLVLFLIGLWWFLFTIPAAFWLRPRPGPPLEKVPASQGYLRTGLAYAAHAWKSLGKTIARARKLKDVLLFLGAWFLLSDGKPPPSPLSPLLFSTTDTDCPAIATISGTAILFAKTTLHMSAPALATINILLMLAGILGSLTWRRLSAFLRLPPLATIQLSLLLFLTIPCYALLGYLPFIRALGVLGLQQPWEMYPLAAVYGLVLGGLSAYCRSLFAELVPPGQEAAFFALYAVTDKGSSVVGPAVVGAITDWAGEIRPAFWFLAVLVALPALVLRFVDVERGRKAAATAAAEWSGLPDGEAVAP